MQVLVVDDEPAVRDALARALAVEGVRSRAAQDGVEALALIRRERPDLAILDVQMPVVSGMEVCRQLRADPETARIPVLMLTALARPEDAEQGYAAGADDYLVKPFSPRELLDRIGALLAKVSS